VRDCAWSCRPYHAGDERHLAPLFEQVFDRAMSPRQWQWKHADRPGPAPNVWLAVDGRGRPISHYGGIPRRLRLGGQERIVMVVADAMTAPEFRRRGAFTAVVTHAHAAWREAGVAFVLGMPNEQHGSLIDSVGWRRICSLRWMIRPLRPERLLQRRVRLGRLPGGGRAAHLWNRYWDGGEAPPGVATAIASRSDIRAAFARPAPGGSGRLALERDADWMIHRLLDAPNAGHEVLLAREDQNVRGYCAFRVRAVGDRRVGAITEIGAGDGQVRSWLVREATRRLRADGAETAIALTVPPGPEHRALRARGFLFSWGEFGVYAVILDPRIAFGEISGPGRWMLSGGDFDAI
jgi:hypothetical protein